MFQAECFAPYKSSQYPMDKTRIQTLIVDRLQADLVIARDALKASHEAATHAESKAENKYDTRGLEAAYLADGQRRRVHEIETALVRSEEHTSELQSREKLVCRLLLEKKHIYYDTQK